MKEKHKKTLIYLFGFSPFKVGLIVTLLFYFLSEAYFEAGVKGRLEQVGAVPVRTSTLETLSEKSLRLVTDLLLQIHQKTIDFRFQLRGPVPVDPRIVVLAGDEDSIGKLGRWPWPRSTQADIIDKLMSYGVKVYGYDAVFSEEENKNNKAFEALAKVKDQVSVLKMPQLLQSIEEQITSANTDWRFAQSIQKNADHVVMGSAFEGIKNDEQRVDENTKKDPQWEALQNLSIPIVIDPDEKQVNLPITIRAETMILNILPILQVTQMQGYFNAVLETDGLIRKSALVMYDRGKFFPSLALQMAARQLDTNISLTVSNFGNDIKGVDKLQLLSGETGEPILDIPVDQQGMLNINFAGPQKSYPYLSIAELYNNSEDAVVKTKDPATGAELEQKVKKQDFLKDKVVLFGMTAIGVYDLRNTPFDEVYPGVETHANVIGNILSASFLRTLPTIPFKKWNGDVIGLDEHVFMKFGLVILGLIISAIISFSGAAIGAVFTILTFGAICYLDKQFLFSKGYLVSTALPLIQILILYTTITFYKYLTEERNKKQLKGTFEKYVSPEVVKQILDDPSKIALGGEKRRMTVMFSDVRGFTTFSEKMEATQLSDFLNAYLSPMTDLVFSNKGTLDKYMGDAIMSFFGAPIAYEDHAKRAAQCALDMIASLEVLREGWVKQGLPPIEIGIGINTGEMSVGNMGSRTVRSYTVMGDPVNLGSRLEGINKDYGTQIIVSEFTNGDIESAYTTREVDWVRVKGKEKPVKIFELVSKKGEEKAKGPVLEKFNEGYALFRQKLFNDALAKFKAALEVDPKDGPSLEYVERCEHFIVEPPPADWNGVVVKKTK